MANWRRNKGNDDLKKIITITWRKQPPHQKKKKIIIKENKGYKKSLDYTNNWFKVGTPTTLVTRTTMTTNNEGATRNNRKSVELMPKTTRGNSGKRSSHFAKKRIQHFANHACYLGSACFVIFAFLSSVLLTLRHCLAIQEQTSLVSTNNSQKTRKPSSFFLSTLKRSLMKRSSKKEIQTQKGGGGVGANACTTKTQQDKPKLFESLLAFFHHFPETSFLSLGFKCSFGLWMSDVLLFRKHLLFWAMLGVATKQLILYWSLFLTFLL